ncbi:S-layer homology domain-containing protein [Paenibacillus donghaensis]|nr:S-layer homology domain-containing protein [Paenibacillus donghaensis]
MKKKWRGLMTGLLGISMLLGSLGSVSAAPVPKDIQGHWAQAQLQDWLNKGYLGGYPDGTVKPNNSITRGEYVALVNRLFGYTEKATVGFKDVKSTKWVHSEVAKAVAAGYIGGYQDNTFRPDKPLSRQEAAVITAKILKLNTQTTTTKFKDNAQIAAWSRGSVAAASTLKILNGYPDGTFKPKRELTRAEAVGIIGSSVVHKPTAPGGVTPTPTTAPTATPAPTASPAPTSTPVVNPGGGSGGGGGGGGTTPTVPTVSGATYGYVGSVTADVYLTPSVTGTVYYVVAPYSSNATAPTAMQVKDGLIGTNMNGLNHGSKTAVANTSVAFSVYGLQPGTEYLTYVTVTDSSGNWSAVSTVQLKTAATTGTPITGVGRLEMGTATAAVHFSYGQTGGAVVPVKYLVLPGTAADPSAQQIANGQNSSGSAVAVPFSGTVTSAAPGTPYTLNLTGLSANTEYKVYLITGSDNTWSPVELIRIHTK